MTQDAPLDQLAARLIAGANKIDGHMAGADGFLDMGRPIEAAMREAAAALSRRVPASGGEADPSALETARKQLEARPGYIPPGDGFVKPVMAENSLQWQWRQDPKRPFDWRDVTTAVLDALINQGGVPAWDGDGVGCVVQMLHAQWQRAEKAEAALATSPIVAAPEGWRLVPEDLLTHISDWENACRIAEEAAPNITVDLADATYWRHQLATIASIRAALAAAPSIPDGKAEPVAWRWKSYLDMPGDEGYFVWSYSTVVDAGRESECEPLFAAPGAKP